jgi:hypothetical protein
MMLSMMLVAMSGTAKPIPMYPPLVKIAVLIRSTRRWY